MIKKVDYEKKRTIFTDKLALLLIMFGIGVILCMYRIKLIIKICKTNIDLFFFLFIIKKFSIVWQLEKMPH